ncbi:probable 2-carboxy-D-arabinitol-1-phosphatase [Gastrolobium bilobum]|uniref:probable 2-carboxy-D-arabinitol-1-phosphatase n=1 Tax=Gastrolobium bilobum TaxID=150636 RepID=UPI002AB1E89C|nr:probable 2-carboxy-D-arabinitol-1-phosphatase [Gastrolobium bilobum]
MGNGGVVLLTTPLCSACVSSIACSNSRQLTPHSQLRTLSYASLRIHCSTSTSKATPETLPFSTNFPATGGAYDFTNATTSLTNELISSSKKVTLLRHGLSTWNAESRIQGSSDLSILTEAGEQQAERCKKSLENMYFDLCFASPISRAKQTAEIIWQGRERPLVYLDSLKELSLYHLEGLKNVDAKKIYPKEYTIWREDPANFCMNDRYPVRDLWEAARDCWKEILLSPGESFLVVTHKSILRALTCTALGLGPERFRSLDINNGGICVFSFNIRGEAMLEALNMTAHMYSDHVYPG